MSSLKERLAKLSVKAIEVLAPELGVGEFVHVKRLTIGDRTQFNEITERQKKERMEKPDEWLVDRHLAELVMMIAVNPDGTKAFEEGDIVGAQLLPASLAERMIRVAQNAAVDRVATSDAEAKKPSLSSPTTPNSTASSN